LDSDSFTETKNWSSRNAIIETSGRVHPSWPQNKRLYTPWTKDYRHTRQDRWIQTELAVSRLTRLHNGDDTPKDWTGIYTCKECHKTKSRWNHTTTDHKEGEQMDDRRKVGENSCNSGDGTDQTGPILDVYDDDEITHFFFRYFASGNTFVDLHYRYRLGEKTRRVCNALWDQLVEEQLPFPTEESWRAISEGFKNTAHFPNCIGSVDRKHVWVLKYSYTGSFNELEQQTFFSPCSSYGRGQFKLSLHIQRCRSIWQGLWLFCVPKDKFLQDANGKSA